MSEQERIDRLLAEGKISAEEAERLRAAVEESEADETSESEVESIERPRLSRLAVAGALCLPGALVAGLLTWVLANARCAERLLDDTTGLFVGWAVLLIGIVLSIAALIGIRESQGELKGRGPALFALILQCILLVLMWCSA